MNPLRHPGAQQIHKLDVEKLDEQKDSSTNVTAFGSEIPEDTTKNSFESLDHGDISRTPVLLKGRLAKWNSRVEGLAGLEARGITRVLPEEKHDGSLMGYLQMFYLWFGMNCAANNTIPGLLGPLVFNLGWVDCVCIVIFANALSSCGASYTGTFGPRSGNRTMVCLCARCIALTWKINIVSRTGVFVC